MVVVLALSVGIAAILLLPFRRYVPVFDGHAYSECVVAAAASHLAAADLRCYGHPAYFHLGYLAAIKTLDPGNPALLLTGAAIVLAIASLGFHRLARLALPGEEHRIDLSILTAAFFFQPAFLATVIQPGLDLPILAGTVWCTVLILECRWALCASVGTAMVFSKETGVLLYGVLLCCYAVWRLVKRGHARPAAMRVLGPAVTTAIPLVAFAVYLVEFRFSHPGEMALWSVAQNRSLWQELLIPRADVYVLGYFAMILVLSFAWIPSSWVVVDLGIAVAGRLRRAPRRWIAGADPGVLSFLTVFVVATTIALTRFVTFSNVRYVAPAIGLLPILAYASLARLRVPSAVRRALLVVYATLLAVSATRTIDPISRAIWGTFQFGTHTMLDMTGLTHECCGAGRDQLTYSLEFARLPILMDSALAQMAPDSDTVIGVPANMNWHTIGSLDRKSRHRTLRPVDAIMPRVMTRPAIAQAGDRPRTVFYFAMPNARDPDALEILSQWYDIGPEQRFADDGYALSVYNLRLKAASQPSRHASQ
jgi:hypothetical protein